MLAAGAEGVEKAAQLKNAEEGSCYRLGNLLVIVVALAGVVGVLIPVVAMSVGFRSTIQADARADRAIVLSRIATDEEVSSLSREDFARIANASEVRRDARGSMYSAVAARAAETATLRAIGFADGAVAIAVVLEALLLALLGAAIGIGIGISYAAFDGATMSTLAGALSGSQLVFSLPITPTLMIGVALLACTLGLAGGLVPAMRAARSNMADALNDS